MRSGTDMGLRLAQSDLPTREDLALEDEMRDELSRLGDCENDIERQRVWRRYADLKSRRSARMVSYLERKMGLR